MIRFSTSTGDVYLKQTPPAISLESKIIQLLSEQFHASVPVLIAINDDLHCFLMKDAGKSLRETLKAEFRPDLLCQAIKQYAVIQRRAEDHIEKFIKLGVPDWRLDKLPILYDQMINQTDFLKADGMTDKELQRLQALSPHFFTQCALLSNYGIPETIGIPDFHDNNILIDPNTKKMTFIDWGEAAIIHPFFSLPTILCHATIHHGVKESDQNYRKLQDACFENWLGLTTKKRLLELFILSQQLWPIYGALANYRLMTSVDLQALNSHYAHRPNRLAGCFREYIASN
ncbi:MAG: aminoglycoside phosphotransferase family protein [Rickettsiaceae bacterium]|nr:aminoglycoside phosphotransferase family protein [Rickettsiaceae bacterium]